MEVNSAFYFITNFGLFPAGTSCSLKIAALTDFSRMQLKFLLERKKERLSERCETFASERERQRDRETEN